MTSAVEMRHISKYFPTSRVLASDDVSLEVQPGEVHAIVGENGAGKTTLMSILYGMVTPDEGEIIINGQEARIAHPNDAIRLGIGMVHQHFKLVPSFTIAENIMLGIEPNRGGFINGKAEAEGVRQLAESFGLPVNPNLPVSEISVGMQQRVEILKILQRNAKILILDEPTAVLTPQEVKELFSVVRKLAQTGHTILLITHKLVEVQEVADRVTVMRRGQNVGTFQVSDVSIRDTATMMVGRAVTLQVEKTPAKPGDVVLKAENLLVAGAGGIPAVFGAGIELRSGEILGIAGVSGNGQTELVEALVGLRTLDSGTITYRGADVTHQTVRQRRDSGFAHIPEDRLVMGLNLRTNLDENVVVTSYQKPPYSSKGVFRFGKVRELAQQIIDAYQVRSARVGEPIRTLSGGNLQKIVLGRELKGDPKLIIANQPTRGLDVGSIEFVHKTLVEERDKGAAVLLISVELDEIMALSDRIIVMFAGKIVGEMTRADATEETLGLLMAGASRDPAELAEKAEA